LSKFVIRVNAVLSVSKMLRNSNSKHVLRVTAHEAISRPCIDPTASDVLLTLTSYTAIQKSPRLLQGRNPREDS